MDDSIIDALSQRVNRLERENRRWKRCGLAFACLAGVGLLMGQASHSSQVVKAQRVIIVDEEGNERIVLAGAKDQATLVLKNGAGQASAVLSAAKESAGLSVTDTDGKLRINLAKDFRASGNAGLWLYDELGKPRYVAGVGPRGPNVLFLDESGKPIVR